MNLEQIDTSTTAGKAEVMRLAAEGRKLASRSLLPGYSWAQCPFPVWDWSAGDYAIIAEPVGPEEVWECVAEIALSDDGYKIGLLGPLRAHRLPFGTKLYIPRPHRADLAGEAK
ncbi:hypothetical protein [Stenotrophomonas indicatrix]|uniref:hypothetical protein n=1 Tax=Stenotrophomonas indicatrix TaxID=2045451 RepID=UPI001AA1AD32|nr:hypothetical protein [Stenotrophomonas indicatrix]MBO1748916.1 hypothetical protein [Stenotrophomonas indicatrix]